MERCAQGGRGIKISTNIRAFNGIVISRRLIIYGGVDSGCTATGKGDRAVSKKDLEELLRRLAYAAYKVARDYGGRNDLRFRMADYRTSIAHAKLMRRDRRW